MTEHKKPPETPAERNARRERFYAAMKRHLGDLEAARAPGSYAEQDGVIRSTDADDGRTRPVRKPK